VHSTVSNVEGESDVRDVNAITSVTNRATMYNKDNRTSVMHPRVSITHQVTPGNVTKCH
jgi:hypothetical protein